MNDIIVAKNQCRKAERKWRILRCLTSFCEKEEETMCAFLKTTKLGKTHYNDLNTSKLMISNIY